MDSRCTPPRNGEYGKKTEWNVPIHNRRTIRSSVREAIRSFISRAALFVKVSAKMLWGGSPCLKR